jgi:hypothetical protein
MIIYRVTNLVNNKIYVGQTVTTLGIRWSQHIHVAVKKGGDGYLGKAIRKYGIENFSVNEIDSAMSSDELNKKEIFWIETLNSHASKNGYNLAFGGPTRAGWKEEKQKTIIRTAKLNKPVICVETGEIFHSTKAAAESIGITPGFMTNVIKGRKSTAKGFHFKHIGKTE